MPRSRTASTASLSSWVISGHFRFKPSGTVRGPPWIASLPFILYHPHLCFLRIAFGSLHATERLKLETARQAPTQFKHSALCVSAVGTWPIRGQGSTSARQRGPARSATSEPRLQRVHVTILSQRHRPRKFSRSQPPCLQVHTTHRIVDQRQLFRACLPGDLARLGRRRMAMISATRLVDQEVHTRSQPDHGLAGTRVARVDDRPA